MTTNIVNIRTLLFVLFFHLFHLPGFAQVKEVGLWYSKVASNFTPKTAALFTPVQILQLKSEGKQFFELDGNEFSALISNRPAVVELSIPLESGAVKLSLAQVNITAPSFVIGTDQGIVSYTPGIFYRGIVNDDPESVASISIFNDNVMVFYSTSAGNYSMGKLNDGSGIYCLQIDNEMPQLYASECGIEAPTDRKPSTSPKMKSTGVGCKTVTVSFECDYKLYQDQGFSVTNVGNYVTGLFNQVSTLYANENIDIQIADILVWTVVDPYASFNNSSKVLNAFRNYRGTNFTGDLAHLLSGRNFGGGIGYLDVICTKSYAFAASSGLTTYNVYPTYSWSVMVVTHEIGHNLGSNHTQSCTWPGGAIDNCYSTEGNCSPGPAPVNGGTIMSYCHLTNYGINLMNGFGPLPGNKIRDEVVNSACLASAGSPPAGLTSSAVTSTSADLSWVAATGATSYNVEYKLASASSWIFAGSTTSTNLTISGLWPNNNYQWHVSTQCAVNSVDALFSTLSGAPCAAPISLTSGNITGSSANITWDPVIGATSYVVEYQTSGALAWTTMPPSQLNTATITGLLAGTTYNWRVTADCSSPSNAVAFTTSTAPTGCPIPTNRFTSNIAQTSATLNWSAVSAAISYSVKVKKAGTNKTTTFSNIAGTSINVSGFSAGTTYEWTVSSKCGTGNNSSVYSPVTSFTTAAPLVNELEEDASIILFPNPAQTTLNITIEGWAAGDVGSGEIYDVHGSMIRSFSLGNGVKILSLDGIADGLYVVYVRKSGAKTTVHKFIKTNK
jgi:hypothetical protein